MRKRTPWCCALIPLAAACSTGKGTEGLRVDAPPPAVRDSVDQPGKTRTRTSGARLTWRGPIERDLPKHPPESLQPGKVAPNIVGKDTDGVQFELEDYRGSIVVLIFSGEWCGPCREEYPYQRQMLERYRDRNVVLLGVNSDTELETIQAAKEREGLYYRTWWDEAPWGPINQAWVRSWPKTFILDEDGVILHDDKRAEEIIEAVDGLLEARRRDREDPSVADTDAPEPAAANPEPSESGDDDARSTGQPDSGAEQSGPLFPPAQLPDAEVARRIARLDSLLLIPMNAYDIHDKGRKHIRAFADSLQASLLTPAQTERIAGYLDELLERHPEATRMITRQQFLVENLTPGRVAPAIVGKDLDGVEFKLEDYRGNIVVLVFTGEWCAPCHAEYPYQRQMLERYEDEDVVLLGINSDNELDRVIEAKEREGLHYRTWWDESTRGPIAQSWIVWSWPTTYILDARGIVRHVDLRGDAIIKAVDELLAEGPRLIGQG